MTFPYVYSWRNNSKRLTLYGRRCRVVCRGAKNSVGIIFEDGSFECVSRYSIRRTKP
jgi:peptide methionine sulfoxide reductase MsrB